MWSNLERTEVYYAVNHRLYKQGHAYHNMSHVKSMYDYLEQTAEPYSLPLDIAVLAHDVVYDESPNKEFRSVQVLKSMSVNLPEDAVAEAAELIMATEKHLVTDIRYSAIIRADLHQLANITTVIENYAKLTRESVRLYNCSEYDFAKNNSKFMYDIRHRVIKNAFTLDSAHRDFYLDVCTGIDLTLKFSAAILQTPYNKV